MNPDLVNPAVLIRRVEPGTICLQTMILIRSCAMPSELQKDIDNHTKRYDEVVKALASI